VISLHDLNNALGHADPESLSRWLSEDPDDAGIRMRLAQSFIGDGSFNSAAAQYELLLDQGMDDLEIHNNLAWSYLQLGDTRARGHAEKAYDMAPNDGSIVDTLGWVQVAAGEFESGTSLLRDAHILQPGDLEIKYHLAYALSRIGAENEARGLLKDIMENGSAAEKEFAGKLLVELQESR